MKSGRQKLLITLASLILLGGFLAWFILGGRQADSQQKIGAENVEKRSANRSIAAADKPPTDDSSPEVRAKIEAFIEETLFKLIKAQSPEEAAAILAELRERIRGTKDEAAATEAILAFLKSGKDAKTNLPFKVGPEGILETSPSLRIALLDLIASLDPIAGADLARQLMDERKSPDEYAIALRNLSWTDLEGDTHEEISTRFKEMIAQDEWLKKPTRGFLEAFDVAVEVSSSEMLATMADLHHDAFKSKNDGVARAAFIALDRIALREPSHLTGLLGSEVNAPKMLPDQRASIMSRLDITDSAHRDVFVRYLNASIHGPTELNYFGSLFPNGNYIKGNRLITSDDPSLSIDERYQADLKVIAELDRIAAGNLQPGAKETLEKIRGRLVQLTTPPKKSPAK